MNAKINRDTCIGCELCANISPEVYEMDDEQIAVVIADPVPSHLESEAQQAADSCPTGAIIIDWLDLIY